MLANGVAIRVLVQLLAPKKFRARTWKSYCVPPVSSVFVASVTVMPVVGPCHGPAIPPSTAEVRH